MTAVSKLFEESPIPRDYIQVHDYLVIGTLKNLVFVFQIVLLPFIF